MSPVEIWGMLYFWQMKAACVPLPAPGAPNKMSLMGRSLSFEIDDAANAQKSLKRVYFENITPVSKLPYGPTASVRVTR
jgi:hypothetical protein